MSSTTALTDAASAVLQHLEDAWNAADGVAFGTAFTDDADFVEIRGSRHHGRAAISAGHQAIFDTIYAGSVNQFTLDSAVELGPGVALAHGRAHLHAPSGPLQGTNESQHTAVLVEQGGAWLIRAFQNTLRSEA